MTAVASAESAGGGGAAGGGGGVEAAAEWSTGSNSSWPDDTGPPKVDRADCSPEPPAVAVAPAAFSVDAFSEDALSADALSSADSEDAAAASADESDPDCADSDCADSDPADPNCADACGSNGLSATVQSLKGSGAVLFSRFGVRLSRPGAAASAVDADALPFVEAWSRPNPSATVLLSVSSAGRSADELVSLRPDAAAAANPAAAAPPAAADPIVDASACDDDSAFWTTVASASWSSRLAVELPAVELSDPLRISTETVDSASLRRASGADPAVDSARASVTLCDEGPPVEVVGPSAPDGRAAEPDGWIADRMTVC
jgi:hypothetical protein